MPLCARLIGLTVAIAVGWAMPAVADGMEEEPRPATAKKRSKKKPAVSKKTTKKTAKKTTKKTAKKTTKRKKSQVASKRKRRGTVAVKSKKRRVAAARAAAIAESRKANTPPGWSWPPSPAMLTTGRACTDKLTELGVKWKKYRLGPEDHIAAPIVIPAMKIGELTLTSTFRKGPFMMDCHLALALAEHAAGLYALGVREVGFSRIHGSGPVIVNGTTKPNVMSRHALGLAMDIFWLKDAGGRKAIVLEDYWAQDALLHAVEGYLNESRAFRTVLTPGNDPASHYDHFHIEAKVEYPLDER